MAGSRVVLTDRLIKSAKPKDKDYRLSDGKGLYLQVTKAGNKSFRLKFRINGKEKKLVIGLYPDVTLQEARIKRDKARALIIKGIDPAAQKQALKAQALIDQSNSFSALADEWMKVKMGDKTPGYQMKLKSSIQRDLIPALGQLPISDITAPMLLQVLRKIEARGVIETANRTKQVAGQIFRYAVATGRAERDPTPDLKGALQTHKVKHFAAITDPEAFGRLLVAVDSFDGTMIVKSALKLAPLFFCRPGELRHIKWENINPAQKRIEIIAEKTHQQHIIPISRQAQTILDDLRCLTGRSEYVFPSARGASRCMSDNALRSALRTLGYDNDTMTPHGFRASARTLLDEVLGFRIEWIEQQLAHAVKDANGRAYNRTKHLKQRADMMQKWADYLDQLKESALSNNVVTGDFRRSIS
ncbi:MAG: tyrosine-type recombinase/integrase [Paraglaciecola chathamensis]